MIWLDYNLCSHYTVQETVLEILRLSFKDQKTRGINAALKICLLNIFIMTAIITVSSDAVKLATDMIYLFVLG